MDMLYVNVNRLDSCNKATACYESLGDSRIAGESSSK